MRHLLTYVIALLMLCCCTTERQRTAMRQGLDSLNRRNRTDQPFTVHEADSFVRFFDRHGTPNDRLLAHYLLGRAYHEHGEAPMALQCYHDALDCADTTAADCDYAQLSRVYGQMALVFYQQGLYIEQLQKTKLSVSYAWKGKDTLLALMNYEQESFAYKNLGMQDSAIFVIEDVASLYERYGYSQNASIAIGTIIRTLVYKGDYQKAKNYIDIYESKSGLFDASGNIARGREMYYNIKGTYYLYIDKLDSAEYYFRKELRDGKDNENQYTGTRGLAQIYDKLHQPDSAAKYYQYAHFLLDTIYIKRTSATILRMQSMYDYTRNQEIAKKKSEEAHLNHERLQFVLSLFAVFTMAIAVLAYQFIRKRKENLRLYMLSLDELKLLRTEKAALSQHQEEYRQIILEKEKRIDYLEQRVKKYGKQVYFTSANAERCLKESPTYNDLGKKAVQGRSLVEEDWNNIRILIQEYLPSFDDFLATNQHRLKLNETHILKLLRLHFKPVDIAGMTGMSKSQISQICSEIMKKIFNAKGSSKELSSRIEKIF